MRERIEALATGRRVAIGWVVFFGYSLVVFPLFDRLNGMPADARPLDLRVAYTPDHVAELFAQLGADGRVAYVRSLLIADIAWPAVYGSVLALTIAWGLSSWSPRARTWAVALPVTAVLLDLIENTSVAVQLALYPPVHAPLAVFASVVTTVKWVAASAATIAAVVALGAAWRSRSAGNGV